MRELFDELLILGSFVLILFKTALYLGGYILVETPISNYSLQFIENTLLIFVLYTVLVILFGVRFISRKMKNYPKTNYYLKSVGWISYAYLIGTVFYLYNFETLNHYELEKIWNKYWISEIFIAISLVIAWIRKHPRFLVE